MKNQYLKYLYFLLLQHVICCFATAQLRQPPSSITDFQSVKNFYRGVELLERRLKWPETYGDFFQDAVNYCRTSCTEEELLLSEYYLLAYYDNTLSDKKTIQLATELLRQSEFIDTGEAARAVVWLNSAYGRLGYYQRQLELIPLIEAYREDYESMFYGAGYNYHHELGMIYYNLADYDLARQQFQIQADDFENIGNEYRRASMENNIALTFQNQGNDSSAITYFKSSLDRLNTLQETDIPGDAFGLRNFKNVVRSNIASLKLKGKDTAGVQQAYIDELKTSLLVKQPRISRQAYLNLARFHLLASNTDSLEYYLNVVQDYEQRYSNPQDRSEMYLLRSLSSSRAGDLKSSFDHLMEYERLNDSLLFASKNTILEEATLKFDVKKTKEELVNSQLKLRDRTNLLILAGVILSMVAILLAVIIYQFTLSRKRNKKIRKQSRELKNAIKEKELLLEETHHRIKNNLQMISGLLELKQSAIDNPDTARVLTESQEYLRSMAVIHEMLYTQDTEKQIAVKPYIESIVAHLGQTYAHADVKFNLEVQSGKLNTDYMTPLGLLINELVTNTVKHSERNKLLIQITLKSIDTGYEFIYKDAGTAIASKIVNEQHKGIGLILIKLLIEEMQARAHFHEDAGFGLTLHINERDE
ncbi:MAG: histidine kinase dimerization/phosphoacceptor domain -containing protein [Nonlabens sp.]